MLTRVAVKKNRLPILSTGLFFLISIYFTSHPAVAAVVIVNQNPRAAVINSGPRAVVKPRRTYYGYGYRHGSYHGNRVYRWRR